MSDADEAAPIVYRERWFSWVDLVIAFVVLAGWLSAEPWMAAGSVGIAVLDGWAMNSRYHTGYRIVDGVLEEVWITDTTSVRKAIPLDREVRLDLMWDTPLPPSMVRVLRGDEEIQFTRGDVINGDELKRDIQHHINKAKQI